MRESVTCFRMALRKKLVWSLAAAVLIVAAIVIATGSLDAPRFRLIGVTEEGPAAGNSTGCARRVACTVTAVYENLGDSRPAVAVFIAHTHLPTNAQGNFQPAGPDAQCSVDLPASGKGQSVQVSCALQVPVGSTGAVLDSPVTVALQ